MPTNPKEIIYFSPLLNCVIAIYFARNKRGKVKKTKEAKFKPVK
jgi:hypothetical protein